MAGSAGHVMSDDESSSRCTVSYRCTEPTTGVLQVSPISYRAAISRTHLHSLTFHTQYKAPHVQSLVNVQILCLKYIEEHSLQNSKPRNGIR